MHLQPPRTVGATMLRAHISAVTNAQDDDEEPNRRYSGTSSAPSQHSLHQGSLALAAGASETGEALAQARRVVADTTARAIAAVGATLAAHDVVPSRALDQAAVGATEAIVAHAPEVLVTVPRKRVCALWEIVNSDISQGCACTVAIAGVRARSALARNSFVSIEAGALAGLAITGTHVRARGIRRVAAHSRSVVIGLGVVHIDPRHAAGACAGRAISAGPRCVRAVALLVALAAIVGAAGAMARASIGTVRRSARNKCDKKDNLQHCDKVDVSK